ncbi:formimidoylglutamate deiminase [Bailinhaonella thermotolerans]|uniref:Formimidoylglutamate deiminase n=1 Tax=Bailinhaonella thermotolerans TaxID=1070861 RepID=A0A3A4BDP8_9ACTN|nr:formimidoylglutamate deiminase [Bailinhaonella thermotolerans]RJL32410.1 formimidoylglutamate deiminase [Bailinhaonella thermotolerans]
MAGVTSYWCELAWLGSAVPRVLVRVHGEHIDAVTPGADPPPGAVRLAGLTIPGLANAHSHAFHRALRGRVQGGRDSHRAWLDRMLGVAARLGPDSYLALARATYAEMALAGITSVGEFHYLHHGPGGTPYDDPNEMGHALIRAARDAGPRIALLDTVYLAGGLGTGLAGPLLRFGDGDAARWAERAQDLARKYRNDRDVEIGAAIHSVPAVPVDQMPAVVEFAHEHAGPVHAHVSARREENERCVAAYSATPTRVLHEHGVLGPRSTAVHATHLADSDAELLGGSATNVCLCPTAERDLAGGVGPARRVHDRGSPITLGSDIHAVIDLFEEARAVELDERLVSQARGHWRAEELLTAATSAGHASLGFPDAGMIVPGARADLVSVRLDSVRTAGATPATAGEAVVFAATAADVHSVVSGGRRVVEDGRHVLGDVGRLLTEAISPLLS